MSSRLQRFQTGPQAPSYQHPTYQRQTFHLKPPKTSQAPPETGFVGWRTFRSRGERGVAWTVAPLEHPTLPPLDD